MTKIDALSLTVIKLAAVAASVPTSAYIVPAFGVGPYTLALAGIGAAMSYAWDPKREENGMGLIAKWFVVSLFSVALVVVLPDLADWQLDPRSEPPLAFIFSLYGRRIMPALKSAIPAMGRGIAGMFSSRGGGSTGYDEPFPPPNDPRRPKDNPDGNAPPDERGF